MEAVITELNFTLARSALLSALQMVSGVVERRQTLPILSHVVFSFNSDRLAITATDTEVQLTATLPLESSVDFMDIAVPARKLMDICRSLPEDAILKIFYDKQVLKLHSGSSRFTLACLPAIEFPLAPNLTESLSLQLTEKDCLNLLTLTQFAMAQEDVRYFLNGCFFAIENKRATVVATDGHRLALTEFSLAVDYGLDKKVIIPRKAVQELIRLIGQDTEELTISIDNNHICFDHRRFCMISKLIDGRFPDYHRVIPRHNDKTLRIDRDVFKQSLVRVAILANEKHHGVRMDLKENTLTLFANNPERDQAQEILDVDYTGASISMGFNVGYLLDILSILAAGTTEWLFSNSSGSVVLYSNSDQHSSTYVVMPLRL